MGADIEIYIVLAWYATRCNRQNNDFGEMFTYEQCSV